MLTIRCVSLAALVVAASVALSFSPAVFAAGNAEAGAAKAATCLACHGVGGNSSNPEWPSLAGQNAAYVAEQLNMFRKGHRQNELMAPMASILTDEDVLDIAAYYASLTPTGLEADAANWKAGEALYKAGDSARNIPACKACHGPVGRGNPGAGYPAVRAQHSVYTINQLNVYAANQRYTDAEGKPQKSRNGHMMVTIAKRLTAEDMQSLASYIQGMR
jgi:cytochrome c553